MKRTLTGIIISNKTKDTVVVQVERILKHPKYQRRYKRHKGYKAHVENMELSVGDKVEMIETRPISKDKKWKVIKLVAAAKKVEAAEEITDDSEESTEQKEEKVETK